MWNWIQRSLQRQRDLQLGVDADLVAANRKKWKWCFSLYGLFLVSVAIQSQIRLSGATHQVAVGISMLLFAGGAVIARWALLEKAFLDKPYLKEPPKLWK